VAKGVKQKPHPLQDSLLNMFLEDRGLPY